jgi:hypothetical protein
LNKLYLLFVWPCREKPRYEEEEQYEEERPKKYT